MILFGLLLSMVGSDLETGAGRMTFDIPELADGIGFVVVAMGVFGFAEIMRNLGTPSTAASIVQNKITGLMPTRADLEGGGTRRSAAAPSSAPSSASCRAAAR